MCLGLNSKGLKFLHFNKCMYLTSRSNGNVQVKYIKNTLGTTLGLAGSEWAFYKYKVKQKDRNKHT